MPFPSIDPMDTFYILNPDDKSINLDKTKEMLKLLNFKVFYMFKFNKHIKYGENQHKPAANALLKLRNGGEKDDIIVVVDDAKVMINIVGQEHQ